MEDNMKTNHRNSSNRIIAGGLLAIVLLLILTAPVFAEKKDGNVPDDPGAGNDQDKSKPQTTKWVLIHGGLIFTDSGPVSIDEAYDVVITDPDLAVFEPGGSEVDFLGIPVTGYEDSYYTNVFCGDGAGIGTCYYDPDYKGNNNNGGGPLHNAVDCGGVWIRPGIISANAKQIAPANAVVVGQDPEENGVTLEYNVVIEPTTVAYTRWQIVGHHFIACVENGSDGQPLPIDDYVETCPQGWHSVIEHIWACSANEYVYREDISKLTAKASLQLDSRIWIQTELAAAYPGAHLINPDWAFSTKPKCAWNDDVCVWNFTLKIPVTDPGFYDLLVEGVTKGTKATPGRSFEVLAGEFGAYFMDDSTIQ
jgi:hypothetical protein